MPTPASDPIPFLLTYKNKSITIYLSAQFQGAGLLSMASDRNAARTIREGLRCLLNDALELEVRRVFNSTAWTLEPLIKT